MRITMDAGGRKIEGNWSQGSASGTFSGVPDDYLSLGWVVECMQLRRLVTGHRDTIVWRRNTVV